MTTDPPIQIGEVIADKYRVERVLGSGGMGVVVVATHLQLDQLVAIKFLRPSVAKKPEAVERFAREARAAAKIQSEHVARVLDVAVGDGGVPYMVMEYLEGKDLQTTLDVDLQAVAELSMEGRKGAVVALDPRNGEVLAMVSRPTFDPGMFEGHIRQEDWNDVVNNPDGPLRNRAIQEFFAGGLKNRCGLQVFGIL